VAWVDAVNRRDGGQLIYPNRHFAKAIAINQNALDGLETVQGILIND
jgi:hypothetical protein